MALRATSFVTHDNRPHTLPSCQLRRVATPVRRCRGTDDRHQVRAGLARPGRSQPRGDRSRCSSRGRRQRPLCLRQACRTRWPPMVWICNPCGWSFSTTRGTSNAERTRPKLPAVGGLTFVAATFPLIQCRRPGWRSPNYLLLRVHLAELSPIAGRAAATLLAEQPPARRRSLKGRPARRLQRARRRRRGGQTAHRRRRSTPVSPSG